MNEKKLKTWQIIYEASLAIAELEPWNSIDSKAVLCYVTTDDNMYFFKILGETSEYCGIAFYTNPFDFLNSHHFDTYGNPKNEPALYMQNAIIGFWGNKEDVSKKNMKILKELKIRGKNKNSWLFYEKYRERLFPEDLNDTDAEILADALGNLYMMLKSVLVDNLDIDFNNGDALLRRYAGNGMWHNIPIDWAAFSKNLSIQATVGNNRLLKEIKKIPSQPLYLEVDARCLAKVYYDDNTDTEFFPMLYSIVDEKTGFIINTDILEPHRSLANEVISEIAEICYEVGRPKKIIINDNRMYTILNYFCTKTDIKLEFIKKPLKKTEEVLKSMFEYIDNNIDSLSDDDDDDMWFEDDIVTTGESYDEIDLSDYKEHYNSESYVISVSVATGCYRHIMISGASTLEELHSTILDAFDFDDDHAHVFFMNNKKWTPGGYYSQIIEDEAKYTCDYKIKEVLKDKQQFVYVFDFGAEWTFKCKVLRIEAEPTVESSVIRSSGKAPFQY